MKWLKDEASPALAMTAVVVALVDGVVLLFATFTRWEPIEHHTPLMLLLLPLSMMVLAIAVALMAWLDVEGTP